MYHGAEVRPGVPYRRPGGAVERVVLESEPEGVLPIRERRVTDWRTRVHPDDRDRLRRALDDDEVDVAYRIHTEGETEWITERGVRTPDGAAVVGYLFPASERVERCRRLERQRERLSEFASVVSHDLRNPLTIAVGNLELARDLDATAATERLDRVHEALDRMDALIGDLLTLAREGQIVEETNETDLERVVEAAWSTTGAAAPAKLVIEEPLPTIACDECRLRQVFENLFRNAIEHGIEDETPLEQLTGPETIEHDAPHNSTVELQTSGGSTDIVRVITGATDDGFYVADDGPGIAPEDRERILEPGQSTHPDGTGFGLAIVERIVTAHGWEIDVTESRFGGAQFEVSGVERIANGE